MIRIRDISFPPEHDANQLLYEASKILRVSASKIRSVSLVRRSVDARKKPDVRIIYTVDVSVDGNEKKILKSCGSKRTTIAPNAYYKAPKAKVPVTERPVVVGFGPAGMFAALILALAGCKPVVLERGEDADTRNKKVKHFFETGELDENSNVQFGEGGAGTFSDGKLNTGVNNPRIGWVLEQFVKAGAREDILYDAKPHIGTDVLLDVVQNLRKRIQALGGEVRFRSQVTGIQVENGHLSALEINSTEILPCRDVVFAIGHSARDTFSMLLDAGVPMESKPFSMGVRIEHPQSMIDKSQYGSCDLPLPPADYKLVCHLDNRTVYTFCMCPGGYVVAAASEDGRVVTNGMSLADRNGENANAAVLVTVNPEDFPYEGVLGGMHWQRELEQRAYAVSGCYKAPAQLVGDFLGCRPSTGPGSVQPSYKPGVTWCDLHDVLPEVITDALAEALPKLDRNLAGFSDADAVLTGPETRSSSPVRILRGENRQSTVGGFYPCGEGAGYAGGIMSAALDGIQTAEMLIQEMENRYGQ
ncbi:MAG: hypothetical protein J6Q30_03360 [Oscillospiraceae bacterium]|nr:hypothetical protein [Oscillospiraceae bacterium]